MEYILILALLFDRAPTTTSILFPTEQACVIAKDAAEKEFRAPEGWTETRWLPFSRAKGVCVPRGLTVTQ